MRKSILILSGLFTILLSCRSSSVMTVEKSPTFGFKITDKIISIEPEYIKIDQSVAAHKAQVKTALGEGKFIDALKLSSKNLNLNLQIISSNNFEDIDNDYFNYLRPLKDDILSALYLQDSRSKGKNSINWFKPTTAVFETTPFIPSKYSHLIDKYNSKYFSVQGVIGIIGISERFKKFSILDMGDLLSMFKKKSITIYYNVVADISKGEIIYQELRILPNRPSPETMRPIIYDSFKVFSNVKK